MNVDRTNRDRLAAAIRRYLAEETTAFAFDDEITDLRDASGDPTLAHVADSLWYHYDDCKDHTVVLSKEEWDYFQRLLLLLESDMHVHVEQRRIWCPPQLGAALGVLGFCFCVYWLDIGIHLFIVAIPFGLFSMLLSRWRRKWMPQPTAREASLVPFSSASEVLRVRRSVRGFIKRRYPRRLRTKRIRFPLMDAGIRIATYAVWLMFSPLVLLLQMFPETDTQSMVRQSKQAGFPPARE